MRVNDHEYLLLMTKLWFFLFIITNAAETTTYQKVHTIKDESSFRILLADIMIMVIGDGPRNV
jgi:hypothetical protein